VTDGGSCTSGDNSVGSCTNAAHPQMRLSRRGVSLGVEAAFEVMARAHQLERDGRSILYLEAGEPDWPTPSHIIEAGVKALRDGLTRYSASPGNPELRTAIAEHAAERGLRATRANVIVSPGSKLAIFHVLLALLEQGDEALLPDPGYPAYESVATFAGGRAVTYGVHAGRADGIDVAEIASKITTRTRVLILNSPHNPTGSAIGARAIEALAELACRHDLTVISDEIYSRLTFAAGGMPTRSIGALPGMADRTVVVDGFSKAYAMTGWRLGYGIMPAPLAAVVSKLLNNSVACTPEFVQMAGIAALTGPQECVTAMVDELRMRRDLLVGGLNAIDGLVCPTPEGAFYVWPDASKLLAYGGITAEALADRLLEEYGVACLAGSAFGHCGGPHLRFSYTTSRQAITTALERLREALAPIV